MNLQPIFVAFLLMCGVTVAIALSRQSEGYRGIDARCVDVIRFDEVREKYISHCRIVNRSGQAFRLIGANNICTNDYCISVANATGVVAPGDTRFIEVHFVPGAFRHYHESFSIFVMYDDGECKIIEVGFEALPEAATIAWEGFEVSRLCRKGRLTCRKYIPAAGFMSVS